MEKKLQEKKYPKKYLTDRVNMVADYFNIDRSRVIRLDHHTCHAYYSYYISPFKDKKVLSLTIDGFGDGLNSTIGIFDKKTVITEEFIKRIFAR